MKKKIFKSLLAIACLLGSTNVSAYDFEVDGIYYNVVSFTELTCKVTSNGSYSGDIKIPATVNYSNRTLTVVEIESDVFYKCSDLTGITIPNTISSIGNQMFNGCTKLENVKIEDGETVLDLGCNYSASSNGTGKGLFYDCPIKTLYLGRNLSYKADKSYGLSPFYGIETIKDVTIGNSVTSIGSSAFSGCGGLTSIEIPNSVTSIGNYAFRSCSGLTSVTIPNSVTSIGSSAFMECSGLTSIEIPNSITSISSDAFSGCSGLTSITIPNSVTSIGNYAFRSCSGLTSIEIPNSVTSIGSSAFRDCSGLTSVTIPNSVTSIGNYAFSGCSKLATLYSLNTTPPSVGSSNFTNNQYMTLNVFVPEEALEAYQSAEPWKNFWNLQGFDPTGIESVKGDAINGNNIYYDIRGNRLDAPKKGLNIINGKKVIMK